MKIKFPKHFKEEEHPVVPNAKQWTFSMNGKCLVSIVGGGDSNRLWGDGVINFEMWDFREQDVRGHMNKKEINKHFKNNPI